MWLGRGGSIASIGNNATFPIGIGQAIIPQNMCRIGPYEGAEVSVAKRDYRLIATLIGAMGSANPQAQVKYTLLYLSDVENEMQI